MRRRAMASVLTLLVSGLLTATAPAALAAGGAVEGVVTGPSGAAAADVCVSTLEAPAMTTQTDESGSYHLDLPAGTYRVLFTDCGGREYVAAYFPSGDDPNSATVVNVSTAVVSGIDVRLVQGGSVGGRVLDSVGQPVGGGQVVRWRTAPTLDTYGHDPVSVGADGSWVMHGVPSGSILVSSALDGVVTFSGRASNPFSAARVPVVAGQHTDYNLVLARGGSISGRVVDDLGEPKPGACIRVWGTSSQWLLRDATAASDGTFTMSGVWPESVRLAVRGPGCTGLVTWYADGDSYDHATPIAVPEGGAVDGLRVVQHAAPHISGRVLDPSGAALANATVQLFDGTSNHYTSQYTRTDADGRYLFAELERKLYKVLATQPSSRPELVETFWPRALTAAEGDAIDTVLGSREDIDLTLPLGASASGRITRLDGSPLAGVCADFYPTNASQRGANAQTDVNGDYRVVGLAPGEFTVAFSDCGQRYDLAPVMWQGTDDRSTAPRMSVSLGQETTGVDGVLRPGGAVHGSLVDSNGLGAGQMCLRASKLASYHSLSFGSAITGADGTWSMERLTAGDYAVEAYACGASSVWAGVRLGTVTVSAGDDVAMGIATVHRAGSFTGTVTNQYGHPVLDVCVTAIYRGSERDPVIGFQAYTDANGRYEFGGLAPGSYTAYFYECGAGMVPTFYGSPTLDAAPTFTIREGEQTVGVDQVVVVFSAPSIPLALDAVPLDGAVRLTWQPPADDGHTPITGYTVRRDGGVAAQLSSSARSYTATGLSNGTSYSFSIEAVNAKGVSPAAAAPPVAPHVPPVPGRISCVAPAPVRSGAAMTLTGRVLDTTGAVMPGRGVTVQGRPAGSASSWSALGSATTGSIGIWSWRGLVQVPTTYRLSSGSVSTLCTVKVAPRLGLVARGRVLTVSTAVARPGVAVYLQRYASSSASWVTAYGRTLNSSGRVSLTVTPGAYRAVLRAVGYWSMSTSGSLRIT